MKISNAFPSKYLRAADIPDGQFIPVIIDRVALEDVSGGQDDNGGEHKPVLFFRGKTKGMVLNKTNAAAISHVYGDDTDDWEGQTIRIYRSETQYGGQMVPCLRVKVIKGAKAAVQPKPQPAAAPEDEFAGGGGAPNEDDVPF